jgi:hypothetical protein
MKRLLTIFCSVSLLALPYPVKVVAQTLTEQGLVGTVSVGAAYETAKSLKPSGNEAVETFLQKQGYMNIAAVPSAPSQYTAFDPNQGPVLLTVDPTTGQVISVVPK